LDADDDDDDEDDMIQDSGTKAAPKKAAPAPAKSTPKPPPPPEKKKDVSPAAKKATPVQPPKPPEKTEPEFVWKLKVDNLRFKEGGEALRGKSVDVSIAGSQMKPANITQPKDATQFTADAMIRAMPEITTSGKGVEISASIAGSVICSAKVDFEDSKEWKTHDLKKDGKLVAVLRLSSTKAGDSVKASPKEASTPKAPPTPTVPPKNWTIRIDRLLSMPNAGGAGYSIKAGEPGKESVAAPKEGTKPGVVKDGKDECQMREPVTAPAHDKLSIAVYKGGNDLIGRATIPVNEEMKLKDFVSYKIEDSSGGQAGFVKCAIAIKK